MNIKDYENGIKIENELKETLENYFNTKLKKLDMFHCMDFCSDDGEMYFEIKSRNCLMNKYETTMIGMNKVKFGENNLNRNVYFIFKFTDKLCYYKYRKEDTKFFDCEFGGRLDRGKYEIKKYYYIPINLLTEII